MIHKTNIDYPGGFNKLADDLGNLTYDSLGEFLELLSKKLEKDALADEGRERHKLAKELADSAAHIKNAWRICRPFMP